MSDAASGNLIYSKGFDSYFGEYKTTEPGVNGIKKTFSESLLIPFPKNKIRLEVLLRDRENQPQPVFSREIDPADMFIVREKPAGDVQIDRAGEKRATRVQGRLGHPRRGLHGRPSGRNSAKTWPVSATTFLSAEPYKTYQDRFNITGVFKASAESGCDEPSYGSFRNTALGAQFDSFGSERYMLTDDNRAWRDIASRVPYDAVLIMVNSPRYGGGGIYNLYCTFTSDNQWSSISSCTNSATPSAAWPTSTTHLPWPTTNSTRAGVEPLEANITALLDAKNLKWKELVTQEDRRAHPLGKGGVRGNGESLPEKAPGNERKDRRPKKSQCPQGGDRSPAGAERGDVAA